VFCLLLSVCVCCLLPFDWRNKDILKMQIFEPNTWDLRSRAVKVMSFMTRGKLSGVFCDVTM